MRDPEQAVSRLRLLGETERRRMVEGWNETHSAFPEDACVHEFFESQAMQGPDRPAVVCDGVRLTYAELNRSANSLAHYLKAQGVGPEVLVGVCIERSVDMLIALLAILKAGGAYVPLDPHFPKARLDLISRRCAAAAGVDREPAGSPGVDARYASSCAGYGARHLRFVRWE